MGGCSSSSQILLHNDESAEMMAQYFLVRIINFGNLGFMMCVISSEEGFGFMFVGSRRFVSGMYYF